jgi:hypothetical protein
MLVECWLWRYRDPMTGEVRATLHPMSADEVAAFSDAKRVRGTKTYRWKMRSRLRRSQQRSGARRIASPLSEGAQTCRAHDRLGPVRATS